MMLRWYAIENEMDDTVRSRLFNGLLNGNTHISRTVHSRIIIT